jgi:hypothetical protein
MTNIGALKVDLNSRKRDHCPDGRRGFSFSWYICSRTKKIHPDEALKIRDKVTAAGSTIQALATMLKEDEQLKAKLRLAQATKQKKDVEIQTYGNTDIYKQEKDG